MAAGSGGAPGSGGTQDTRVDRMEEGLAGIQTETADQTYYDSNWPTYPLTPASLTTSLTGTNNDLVFKAQAAYGGLIGNSISVTYVDPGGTTATLGVVVTDYDIVVNLGRAASAINTTAAALRTAVMANAQANALVSVVNAGGNDGTGLVTAMSKTNLSGATAATRATFDDGRAVGTESGVKGLSQQVDTQWENSGIDPWDALTNSDPTKWAL